MIDNGTQNNKPIILIIEDDEQHRGFLCELLQVTGFNAVAAKNGKEGVALYNHVKPDLVITDIVMPEMDGFEVVQTILSYNKNTPLIAMSGYSKVSKSSYLNMISMLGADAILGKPINSLKLIETINKTIKNKSLDINLAQHNN